MLAFRPKPIVEAQCAPLVDYLNHAQTGAHVRLHVLTYPEMEQAVAQRKVDIVLTQPANYVQMSYRYGLSAPFATLVNLEGNVPLHAYGGVIVTKAERTDLRGKKIATVSRRSFGGYLMAAYELSHAGVPLPQGDRLVETGVPHDRAIEAVLAGDADAAFVRSGLIESMMKEGKLREGQLRVLNRQDQADYPHALSTRLYPEWPVATLPHVDEEIANNIAAALLRLPHGGTVARKADVNGFVVPMDYSPVIEVLKSLRQPPFDKAPEFSLGDIWRKHFWQLVLVGIMLVLILLVLVLLMRYNRRLFDLKNRAEAGDQRLRQFSAQLPGVIFQYHLRQDGTAHFPYVSEGAQALYGVSPDAMNEDAKNLSARIHPEDVAQYQARICQSAETMQEWRGEYRIVLSDGSVHWRMSSATPQRLNDGTLLWHGYAADIDDRKAEEARSELLVAALEASANAIVITDLNGQIRWGNQAFCEMTGYQQDELIGAHSNILRSGKHGKSFYRNMWKTLKAGNPWRGEVINRRKDGRLIDEELIITPVKDKKGNVHHYISVQQDISERKRMEAELRIQASTDTLTGLPNRR
ncbi:MAG: PhnD/SsuA/transferrin family substrate-binding protein, partial [Burkholderiaceae bacterium]|nr:PhnD/SsuA/transferrin family substrate-binding protein [Burkholderiaceae bacterium]